MIYPNLFVEQDKHWAATRLVPEPTEEPEFVLTSETSDHLQTRAPPYEKHGGRVVGVTSDLIAAVCRQIGRVLLVLHGDRLVYKEMPV